MNIPEKPKIYHIVHFERLSSIISNGCLWCDAEAQRQSLLGTTIGMNTIKQRRLNCLRLNSFPDLYVGDFVPFYFCPRSIMLYLIHQANHAELDYRGGQEPIIHLEADLYSSVKWARQNNRRWAFTLSNAGAFYFEDRCDLKYLNEINWKAVFDRRWSGPGIAPSIKEGKQAEFLMEKSYPWHLTERIGVYSSCIYHMVVNALESSAHKPKAEIKREWYY